MPLADTFRLIFLAAIWGSSFMFMRMLAPTLGPVITAEARVGIAGVALIAYLAVLRIDPKWKENWRAYTIIGVVNSALPFFLFSFAALHIPASYSAILNATSPLFSAVLAALVLGEALTLRKVGGVALGISGVALVSQAGGAVVMTTATGLSMLACLGSALCYSIAGIYIKRCTTNLNPVAIAGCSQVMAGLALLPLVLFSPPLAPVTAPIIWKAVAFSLLCSALAYVIYYKLIASVGPTKALTVTFLAPVSGMLWAAALLGEIITPTMVAGCGLILLGATFVLWQTRVKLA